MARKTPEIPYLHHQETTTKHGIKATIRVEAVLQATMPPGYSAAGVYHLVSTYELAQGGELTEAQDTQGRALTSKLEADLGERMQQAGWRRVRRVTDLEELSGQDGSPLWTYQPLTPIEPRGKVVQKGRHLEQMYAGRKVRSRTVTFACAVCGQEVTEEHFPGQKPRYCAKESCQKEANRLRVARFREKKKRLQENE
jgi:hypothetical protein